MKKHTTKFQMGEVIWAVYTEQFGNAPSTVERVYITQINMWGDARGVNSTEYNGYSQTDCYATQAEAIAEASARDEMAKQNRETLASLGAAAEPKANQ